MSYKFNKINKLRLFLFVDLFLEAVQVNGEFITTITSYAAELPTLPSLSAALFTPAVPTALNPYIHKYGAHLANDSFFIICGSVVAFFTAVCILAFLFQHIRDRRAVNKYLQDEEFAGLYNSSAFLDKNKNVRSDYKTSPDNNVYKESKLNHYCKETNWEDSDTDKDSSTFEINDDDTSTIADEKELQEISKHVYKTPGSGTIHISSSSKNLLDNFYAPVGKKFTYKQEDLHFSQLESNKRNSRIFMYISPLTEIMASKEQGRIDTIQTPAGGSNNIASTNLSVPTPTTSNFDFKSPAKSEFRMNRQQANRLSVLHSEKNDHPVSGRPPSQLLEDMFDFDATLCNNINNNVTQSSVKTDENANHVYNDYSQENEKYLKNKQNTQTLSRISDLKYGSNINSLNGYALKRISYSEEKKRISPIILQQKRSSYQQSRQISNNFKYNPNDSNIYIQLV